MVIRNKNYTGRKVDLFIMDLRVPQFDGEAGLKLSDPVRITTGIQKLVQIYMITFLTAVDSKVLDRTAGTAVGDLVVGGVTPSEDAIRHLINISAVEAQAQILEQQEDLVDGGEVIPDDELLETAQLTGLAILNRTDVRVDVTIVTVAGDLFQFVVPIIFAIT